MAHQWILVQSLNLGPIWQASDSLSPRAPGSARRPFLKFAPEPATLHDLLQIVFDWSDFHLHRFVIRGKEYGVSRMGCATFTTDARKVLPSQFRFRVNERFLYEYDFGDLWQHQIRFEGVQPIPRTLSAQTALARSL
jgi:hypothetical protein